MTWTPVVGPITGKEEAERIASKIESKGKGWWKAKVEHASAQSAKPDQWEIAVSSSQVGKGKADAEHIAAKLNRLAPCRGLAQVREADETKNTA
jgi:hypothetical protein